MVALEHGYTTPVFHTAIGTDLAMATRPKKFRVAIA